MMRGTLILFALCLIAMVGCGSKSMLLSGNYTEYIQQRYGFTHRIEQVDSIKSLVVDSNNNGLYKVYFKRRGMDYPHDFLRFVYCEGKVVKWKGTVKSIKRDQKRTNKVIQGKMSKELVDKINKRASLRVTF
ncbi:MAG: hypothetical protein JKY54_04135 [Flavobacteriales bacterium]|nr:hypothetical protein [Flavobacteriales bacterium]